VQIFISFASEQKETAELIAVVLRERGYKVFFSKDTLPAAESFDVRIERAVKSSNLFIFLISPESVTKGKYTLTELAFAREKWSSPGGHVLPVMIAPTPMNTIPVYLRSVSLFEPEGNVATDTAVQADKILKKANRRDVVSVAIAGAVTGVITYLVLVHLPTLLQFPFLISLGKDGPTGVSVLPGVLFGAIIAFSNWKFGIRDKLHLGVIIAFTLFSWVFAVNLTELTYDQIAKYTKAMPLVAIPDGPNGTEDSSGTSSGSGTDPITVVPPPTQTFPFIAALAGMVGGLIGGVGTLFGVAVVNVKIRRMDTLLPIAVVATLLGLMLQVAFQHGLLGDIGYMLLFVSWQAVVAALITRALLTTATESQ
jgi:hypothetical protein